MISSSRRAAGFTLIELLVAVALFAVVGVLGYRGLETVRQSAAHVTGMAERWQELARALDRVGRDVRQAVRRPGRQVDGSRAPAWWGRAVIDERPGSAQLVFSRLGGIDGDTRRLGYRWRGGRVELLLWNSPESPLPPSVYPLIEQVRGAEFAYLDTSGNWRDRWPAVNDDRLPRALRLRLELEEGGRLERIFDLEGDG
jgi:general secretion pathway protein J